MQTILTLCLFLVLGLAGSWRFVSRASRRYPWNGVLVTGVEFLALGLLLGPRALAVLSRQGVTDLEPIVYLALGSIGMLVGIEITWGHVQRISARVKGFIVRDVLVTSVLMTPVGFLVMTAGFPDTDLTQRVLSGTMLGICAAISSPTLITVASRALPVRGAYTNAIKLASSLSPLAPLFLYGFFFSMFSPHHFGPGGIASGGLWWLFVSLVALVLGGVTVLFTAERCSDDEMLLLILGSVLLVGGVCYFLRMSPLYTGAVMGLVVGNFSRKREQIFRELHVVEKLLFVVLLVLLGASLALDNASIVWIAALYTAARILVKFVGTGGVFDRAFLEFGRAARVAGNGRRTPFGFAGLAWTAQGGMALAIVYDFAVVAHTDLALHTLEVAATAVVLADLSALGLVRLSLVRGAGRENPGGFRPGRTEGDGS